MSPFHLAVQTRPPGIANVTEDIVVTTEGENQIVTGTATDNAGNTASVDVTLNIDKTPPTLTIDGVIDGQITNQDLTPVFSVIDNLTIFNSLSVSATLRENSSLTENPFISGTTISEEGNYTLSIFAEDQAGNTNSLSISFTIDKVPPNIEVTSPMEGDILNHPDVTITGTLDEPPSGGTSITCNGVPAVISGSSFTCTVTLAEGESMISIAGTDIAENVFTTGPTVTLDTNAIVAITTPEEGLVTAEELIEVTGTVSGSVAVFVNGIAASVSDGMFTATDIPLVEGTNVLVATAENFAGGTASATLLLRHDTSPPLVVFKSPQDGDRVVTDTLSVAGTVNDIIPWCHGQ